MSFIPEYLRAMDGLMQKTWGGEANNLYAKVLAHGRPFKTDTRPRPKGILKMRNKECFSNASRLAHQMYSDLIYCEGYALTEGIPVAIHHAWVVGPNGIVIDPTWKTVGTEYFGIPFDEEYHLKSMGASGYYSIIDNYQWRDFIQHDPAEFLFKGEIHAY